MSLTRNDIRHWQQFGVYIPQCVLNMADFVGCSITIYRRQQIYLFIKEISKLTNFHYNRQGKTGCGYAHCCEINTFLHSFVCWAFLPTGLYILPLFILLLLFYLSQIISAFYGLIFTIFFREMKCICLNSIDPDLFPIAQGTLP